MGWTEFVLQSQDFRIKGMKKALVILSFLQLMPLCAKANSATPSGKEKVCLVYNIKTRHSMWAKYPVVDTLWLKPQDITRFDSPMNTGVAFCADSLKQYRSPDEIKQISTKLWRFLYNFAIFS